MFPAHITWNALKYKSFSVEKNGLPIASAMKKKAKLFIVCKLHALLDGNPFYWNKKKNTFVFLRFNVKCSWVLFYGFADNLFKFDSLPERIFRAKLKVTNGDKWTTELADQSSLRFHHRAKFYQDAIDQMINRSDLKEGYKRSDVLALDG